MNTSIIRLILLPCLLILVFSSTCPPGYAESDKSLVFLTKDQAAEQKQKMKTLMSENKQLQEKVETLETELADHKTQLESLKKDSANLLEAFKFIRANATILWTSKTGSRLAGLLIDVTPGEVSLMTPKGKQQNISYNIFSETDQQMLEYFRASEESQTNIGRIIPSDPGEVVGAGRIEKIIIPAE